MPEMEIDREFLIQILTNLVRISSVNPSLVAGGSGEQRIAGYIADVLRRLKLEVSIHEPEPGRPSVLGRLKGKGVGRSLMLNGHTDTVGVEGMHEPFSASISNGKMYGRGTYDMKGSLAACIAAAKALQEGEISLAGDFVIAAVSDEEYASIGTADLITKCRVDGAIVVEPTEMELCVAHKGFMWIEVETEGRAAHGSRYQEGIDANMHMGRFLAELGKLEKDLRGRGEHPLIGPPSLHAAKIAGGTEWSTYADRCKLQIERRTVPGEVQPQIVSEVRRITDKLAAQDPTFKATVQTVFTREPFEASMEWPLVEELKRVATRVLGRVPAFVGHTAWMDSALLSAAGIETVVMGPKGAGAHSDEEWVDLDSLVQLAKILVQTTLQFCR